MSTLAEALAILEVNYGTASVSEIEKMVDALFAAKIAIPDQLVNAYTHALNRERPGAGIWQVVPNGRFIRVILRQPGEKPISR